MAGRIRTVKPEWLEDEKMSMASVEARLLSIALLLLADDYGHGRAHPSYLGGQAFLTASNPTAVADAAFKELLSIGFVTTYEVRGQMYYEVRNWGKHQRVDRPGVPKVPSPLPTQDTGVAIPGNTEDSLFANHSREPREPIATEQGSGSGSLTTLPAYASKLAETVGEALTNAGLTDVVETANKCAKAIGSLAPEDLWQDLPAEVALWAAHAVAKKLERAGMGDHWTNDRVLHEVFSKCQSRARYRPSDARKEREARRVAKAPQQRLAGGMQGRQMASGDGGGAIDWQQVREDALAADREQAQRAARADQREAVDPKAMADAAKAALERFKKKS